MRDELEDWRAGNASVASSVFPTWTCANIPPASHTTVLPVIQNIPARPAIVNECLSARVHFRKICDTLLVLLSQRTLVSKHTATPSHLLPSSQHLDVKLVLLGC